MNRDDVNRIVEEIGRRHGRDRWRILDIVRDVQARLGAVGPETVDAIAAWLSLPRVEVEGVVSFYAFHATERRGRIVIRLCDDVIDRMAGYDEVRTAFERALGIRLGETTADGEITLERTACIGMCDQAPAALVNDVVVTSLSSDKARSIVRALREHRDPAKLVLRFGDGNNAHPLVRAMVANNVQRAGPIVFSVQARGEAIKKAVAMSPAEVIRAIKTSRLRGRGGAGFPTGMKWEFARAAAGDRKYVVCNADEGEPGTFKDRVLLTELPDRVFAGLTIAGYAIGASEGIVYLRAEYAYLKRFLEAVLDERRRDGLLGASICGRKGFDFDIRIQLGAGAYICGEETALINSCEGRRGEPRARPPFPAQRGYLGCPTVVNNVETLACVTRILEAGPATFCEYGTHQSSGTKLLSISGDCTLPGVYEVPMGITLREVLAMCGAENAAAVQVGGPSREMVGPADFDRTIDYDDLATGGAVLVFGADRSIPQIVSAFMEFFVHESCGFCTPCRVGTVLLKEKLDRIIAGKGEPKDLVEIEELANTVSRTSRCGLGQASPNPILMTLRSFRPVYEALVKPDANGYQRSFDLAASTRHAAELVGRPSTHREEATS
ncbi:MAG: NAD(P)H-dependent oxidoreductase subunit E [Phycisphaerales bacterium]